ncbi:MAG: conjugal transfer protein TraR [Gammaproteobacteria bacterium]|nr:MAG: conjugal transfer protein TraR [Gammaproteobacteria bacterium]
MEKIIIEQFRQKLLDLKTELKVREEYANANSEPVELDQAKVGRLSRMDAMQARQIVLETSRRRKEQLLRVQAALRRIELNGFGYCVQCDTAMDIRRLNVDPSHAKCIQCAD